MSGKRIVFTGGSGKAGRHAVAHLVAHGYSVLNVDLKPLETAGRADPDRRPHRQRPGVQRADHPSDLRRLRRRAQPPRPPDAVVHFAAIPRVLIEPDNVDVRQERR